MITAQLLTAFTLLGPAWLPTGLRWNQAQFPIPYCITTNATSTNLSANQQRTEVLRGINAWVATGAGGSLSCTTYTAVASAQACQTNVNGNDQRFNIFWEDNWGNGQSTIGVTWSTGGGSNCGNVTDDTGQGWNLGCKFDSDIEFNDRDFFWDATGANTDVASITTHEYGHFIGLDHCNDNGTCNAGGAVMYAAYVGGTVRIPFNDDVQGACALYPGNPGGLGWPCNNNNQCNSQICVNPGPSGFCSQTCGSCPSGFICDANPANPAQMVCLRDDGLNRDQCEVCQFGAPGACVNNGICIGGLPSSNEGRCVMPCGAGGTCDADYQCLTVQFRGGGSGDYCFPRSNDCNDPGNFVELTLGQRCTGNPPCQTGLTCVGICAPSCMPGTCPTDWGCEEFQNNNHFCLPGVVEGRSCDGLVSCLAGPCLVVNGNATCFKDCAGNPLACNNAQTCNTYNLSGGGQVSICEPPGVPPRPDAGFPDTGVVVDMDGGVTPNPDATVGPGQDGSINPGQDGGVSPGSDGGGVSPSPDSGTGGPNNLVGFCAQQTQQAACACDLSFSCDPGCESCDPECPGNCPCDTTFACDPGCDCCDPECREDGCNCAATTPSGGPASPLALLALLGLLWIRRRK